MGLSKSARMWTLLTVDVAFFLLELIVGSSVHSLALVADSFHMLNDVVSMCIGIWAVKIAGATKSNTYTYGWQRAEILGALVNGVFLVALCLSIFLEAIQRFVEPTEVGSPKLVLIVGCCGLASNILGLLLFHDHGHSHGGHGHDGHAHDDAHAAEEGTAYNTIGGQDDGARRAADQSGNLADVLPENVVAEYSRPKSSRPKAQSPSRGSSPAFTRNDEDASTAADSTSSPRSMPGSRQRRAASGSRKRLSTDMHPASFRNEIIAQSKLENIEQSPTSDSSDDAGDGNGDATEYSPLLGRKRSKSSQSHRHKSSKAASTHKHSNHKHRQPKSESTSKGSHGHGHNHADLNMRGVFLHVMGDALGNIGVIASALIIWLTDYSWRFYSDPAISLIITIIILTSAIPLCKAASRILLQAVPHDININDIKHDIEDLEGVVSCHHVHVWQLSEKKTIASLHVQLAFEMREDSSEKKFMKLAKEIRLCLHEHGIHSVTIQPEFCLDKDHDHSTAAATSINQSREASIKGGPDACLLDCDDGCDSNKGCCAPAQPDDDGHGHGHGHAH